MFPLMVNSVQYRILNLFLLVIVILVCLLCCPIDSKEVKERGLFTRWSLWGGNKAGNRLPINKPYEKLNDQDVARLIKWEPDDYTRFNQTLRQILIPRVAGSQGNVKVRNFIVDYLKQLEYDVELDSFVDKTPMGKISFTNIVGTLNPNACRRVVLACHYDSKYFENFEFLGATDSAVPCTMILELARILREPLKKFSSGEVSLQLIFFDGEEAFRQWTATDSLYGSRHLAGKLSNEVFARSHSCFGEDTKGEREIDRIDLFMLLDLIGEESPTFCNYYKNTFDTYDKLTKIEKRLNRLKLLQTRYGTKYFPGACFFSSAIEDDHIPFQQNDVKVLHIIATPFPSIWHTVHDNANAIHHPTVNNLMKIFKLFLVQHLGLEV